MTTDVLIRLSEFTHKGLRQWRAQVAEDSCSVRDTIYTVTADTRAEALRLAGLWITEERERREKQRTSTRDNTVLVKDAL